MLEFVLGDLSVLIATHGLWIMAVVIGLESLGLPLPGETVLVTASGYAGAAGNLSLVAVIVAAVAGAVIGDSLGFWVGRSIGQRALIRHGPRIGITPEKIRMALTCEEPTSHPGSFCAAHHDCQGIEYDWTSRNR